MEVGGRLYPIQPRHGLAISVVTRHVRRGDRRDETLIRGQKPIGRRGAHPAKEVFIERAVVLTTRRRPADPCMHGVNAGDDPPSGAPGPEDADHRGDACALRAPDRVGLVGRMVPDARPDAGIGEFQQHGRDTAHSQSQRILVDAPLYRRRMQERGFAHRVGEVDLPTEVGGHLDQDRILMAKADTQFGPHGLIRHDGDYAEPPGRETPPPPHGRRQASQRCCTSEPRDRGAILEPPRVTSRLPRDPDSEGIEHRR